MKNWMTARWLRIAVVSAAGMLVGGGSLATYRYVTAADDCCQEGAPCCYPGSPCCARNRAHRS
ncbi:MAG: hypothetical protein Q8Q09_27670 [Deltaproteobacteria bacterium]|nr:hypothetical protein [Deltaproteobacteria bacterium]